MNISDIGTVFGMIVVAISGATTGAGFYADSTYVSKTDPPPYDTVYVLVASQNLKLLYDAEDELARLNERSVCDSQCIARKATLKERIRNLKSG